MRQRKTLAIFLGMTLLACALAADSKLGSTAQIKDEWLEGDRARFKEIQDKTPPPLAVENWTNSEAIDLSAQRGKVVMLDFWATWCGPCIASIPHNNDLAAKYKDQGLIVIGVCHTRGAEKMADTVKAKEIKYPVAADVGGKTNEAYKVDSYPDYYFIDRAGKLRICDCANGSVADAIKALLAEPAPTP